MCTDMPRRDFLKSTPAALWMLAQSAHSLSAQTAGALPTTALGAVEPTTVSPAVANAIEAFDYHGVTLHASRVKAQFDLARSYYLSISNDDILNGFRAAAGLPAPGTTLGGWCAKNSNTVFGQWLSGMSRMYRATGDTAIRDKAATLMAEFTKTVKPNGDAGMNHYPYEKLVCGLVDMKVYGDHPEAIALLDSVTGWAEKNLDRARVPATQALWFGRPNEWYTLAENLYRAHLVTGEPRYKTFAEVWLYPQYWNKFAATSDPKDAHGVHAYSHVNTFSSAAMAYAVTGDPQYLQIIKNAYDFLQNRQCYATGGFGPIEHIMPSDGGLGRALEYRPDDAETGCGSWAAFKLSRYLMQYTGEARYGDWMERVMYNCIGAALPVTTGGKNFYYADYRMAGGMKIYKKEHYTCCSGTYLQCMADYHNVIYYKDAKGVYVNLYVPSELVWDRPGGQQVRLTQDTKYPEAETTTISVNVREPTPFALRFRVPSWSNGVNARINGQSARVTATPGTWAVIDRTWNSGDSVEITIPLHFRMQAVDEQHPERVAVVRGPVVYVLDAFGHSQNFRLPDTDAELDQGMRPAPEQPPGGSPASSTAAFTLALNGRSVGSQLVPFYAMDENAPYKMYFDKKSLPMRIW